jgi:hypothetical protein
MKARSLPCVFEVYALLLTFIVILLSISTYHYRFTLYIQRSHLYNSLRFPLSTLDEEM